MLGKGVKKMRIGVQREEMGVKGRNGNMMIEGNAVRHRRAEYFNELLNVEDDVKGMHCGGK